MAKISGVWKFNETVTKIDNLGSMFVGGAIFKSNGVEYDGIRTYTNILLNSVKLQYRRKDNYAHTTVCVMNVGTENDITLGWVDESYRYIDFGMTPFEPSEEFYEWLTANATFQAVPLEAHLYNGTWQKGTFYKRVNNAWVKHTAYRRQNGAWVKVKE